jgi:hypothetical protein
VTVRQLTIDEGIAALERGRERATRGIRRAARKAGSDWTNYAVSKLEDLCRVKPTVWAGDLRDVCDWKPATPPAWAAPWRMGRQRGFYDPRPVGHRAANWPDGQAHLCPIYRSLVYRSPAGGEHAGPH